MQKCGKCWAQYCKVWTWCFSFHSSALFSFVSPLMLQRWQKGWLKWCERENESVKRSDWMPCNSCWLLMWDDDNGSDWEVSWGEESTADSYQVEFYGWFWKAVRSGKPSVHYRSHCHTGKERHSRSARTDLQTFIYWALTWIRHGL